MMVGIVVAIAGALVFSDLIFALTAIAFMLLLAVLLAAQKNRRVRTTWVIGVLWFLLALPLALVFSRYLAEGRGLWTLLPLGLVLLFMLLLAVLLAAQINHRVKTTWVIGVLWLLLAAPLALVFSRYLAEGRSAWTLFPLSLVLFYMLAKALLDFVFRIDFGRNRIAHLASLTLMCLALFSLIWIAFSIHPSWGTSVLIAFGILVGSLIFLCRNEIRVR
jgi:hypothetical protein